MAAISSPGVGSGLDVSGIVNGLINVEKQPLIQLQSEASKINVKVSAWGRVQSGLSSLQDAARSLLNTNTFTVAKATSSDESKLTVTSSSGATASNYAVTVANLARKQSLTSSAMTSSSAVPGDGTLSFTLGSVSGGVFTADPDKTPVSVTIDAGSTLSQIRDAINGASAGVTASIITDANGARLAIRSNDTGAKQAFQISVADSDGDNADAAGLSQFAYAVDAPGVMTLSQSAANASMTIDGVSVSSASNTVTGAVDGVTFNLVAPTTSPVAVAVSSDNATMTASLQGFVDAYNSLNKTLSDLVRFDPAGKSSGVLQGDRSATQLQAQLREMMRSVNTSGSPNKLSDIGMELQRDGSLKINSSKLNNALATPSSVASLFQTLDANTPANSGLARRLGSKLTEWLGSSGTVTSANQTLSKRLKVNQSNQEEQSRRLDAMQKRLLKTYTDLDAQIAKMRSISIPSATTNSSN